jgi:hypothetical protein
MKQRDEKDLEARKAAWRLRRVAMLINRMREQVEKAGTWKPTNR